MDFVKIFVIWVLLTYDPGYVSDNERDSDVETVKLPFDPLFVSDDEDEEGTTTDMYFAEVSASPDITSIHLFI